jgi:hypothetical protein
VFWYLECKVRRGPVMKLNVLVKKLFPLRRDDRFLWLLYSGGQHALEAAEAFASLLEDYDDREAKVERIKEIEDRGDQVRHEVMRNLHRTFMTPIDREDIALLSEHIDDVIDAIEEAARFLLEYDVAAPTARMKELSDLIVGSARHLAEALDKLRLGGDRSQEILRHSVEINRLENESDLITNRAVGELFQEVESPIEMMKLLDVYRMLEQTTDYCEDAANVLEGIVLKNS